MVHGGQAGGKQRSGKLANYHSSHVLSAHPCHRSSEESEIFGPLDVCLLWNVELGRQNKHKFAPSERHVPTSLDRRGT